MKEFYIDCTGLGKEDLHRALAECLDFPDWYGNNLDALYDELTAISQETLLVLYQFDTMGDFRKGFRRVLRDAEQENPKLHIALPTMPPEVTEWKAPCAFTLLCRQSQGTPTPEQLAQFIRDYGSSPAAGSLLVNAGDECMQEGDPDTAQVFLRAVEHCPDTADLTTLYLRLAQIHLEKGDQETGTAYLIRLCTEGPSNYEESISFRELTDIWDRYKHLVDGLVPPPTSVYGGSLPLSPAECSRPIADILALPEDEILSALSDHLDELSGGGDSLNCLNKWERNVFYLDELTMEVNSGGFDSYLYYYGEHFARARKALTALNAPEMTALLDAVTAKFPRGKVPKSMDAIQNAMDKLEEQGVDFETEDDTYYTSAEQELLPQLLAYVLANRKHFR